MEMSSDLKKHLNRVSTWGKTYGIIMIICGILSAIIGVFSFGIGSIPGLITIYLGYTIYKTGTYASDLLASEGDPMYYEEFMKEYGRYLLANVIYMLVSIILIVVLSLVIGGVFLTELSSTS